MKPKPKAPKWMRGKVRRQMWAFAILLLVCALADARWWAFMVLGLGAAGWLAWKR